MAPSTASLQPTQNPTPSYEFSAPSIETFVEPTLHPRRPPLNAAPSTSEDLLLPWDLEYPEYPRAGEKPDNGLDNKAVRISSTCSSDVGTFLALKTPAGRSSDAEETTQSADDTSVVQTSESLFCKL